jgi:hypothetical protein
MITDNFLSILIRYLKSIKFLLQLFYVLSVLKKLNLKKMKKNRFFSRQHFRYSGSIICENVFGNFIMQKNKRKQ